MSGGRRCLLVAGLASATCLLLRAFTRAEFLIETLDFVSGDARRGWSDVYQGAWHGFDDPVRGKQSF